MHDNLIARIDKVRRKQARITKHIHAQTGTATASAIDEQARTRILEHVHEQAGILVALDDELCELLTEAAQIACDAGHITGGVAAAVVAPK